LDVGGEPEVEEVEDFGGEGGGGFEAGLERKEIAEEVAVFALVVGGVGIEGVAEEPLFAGEVELGVGDEAVEMGTDGGFVVTGDDGGIDVVEDAEEEVVVFVEGADAEGEAVGPGRQGLGEKSLG
jgi:hypothetical protein